MNMNSAKRYSKILQKGYSSRWGSGLFKYKTIIAFFFIIVFTAPVNALHADEVSDKKINITIYNFKMLKTPEEEGKKVKTQEDYAYYSVILPETVSKKLQESDKFIISRDKKAILGNSPDPVEVIKENYEGELSSEAKNTGSDYLIAGQYEVKDGILYVRILIYNALIKDLQEVSTSGNETGLYLKNTTDTLSESIDEKLKHIIVAEIEKSGKSPFLPLAKPLQYTSIGFDSGYVYITGKWQDIYNNAVYYSPYISFDITGFLDLTLKFDYFNTDSENKDTATSSALSLTGGSLLLSLKYQALSNLGLYLYGGAGYSHSEITVDPSGPFTASLAEEKSNDPSAEIGFGLKINLYPIFLRTGIEYKKIFFKDEPMNLGIIYAGAGIHF